MKLKKQTVEIKAQHGSRENISESKIEIKNVTLYLFYLNYSYYLLF